MAKRKPNPDALTPSLEAEGGVAVAELPDEITHADNLPPIPPVPRQQPVRPAEWRFKLQGPWVYPFVVIIGVEDEAAARAELHRQLDAAILDVQRTGR